MKKALQYIFPFVVLLFFLTTVLVCNVSSPLYNINFRVKKTVVAFFPEGWSFFTRAPRGEMIGCYKIDPNGRAAEFYFQNGSPSNFFGISRRYRKIEMEISGIATSIPDSLWRYTNLPQNIIEEKLQPVLIEHYKGIHIEKDSEYIIEISYPIAWAWANNKKVSANRKFVRIKFI